MPVSALSPGSVSPAWFARPADRERWSWLLLLLLVPLLLPIAIIAGSALFPWATEHWTHLWHTVLGEYIRNSAWLGLGVICGTLALGILPAWLVTMCRFPGRRLWAAMLIFPLAFPAYILAYVYTGLLNGAAPWPGLPVVDVPGIHSLAGAVLVLSFALYPYVYLLARAAFAEQSYCALEAARMLGCSGAQAFWRVGLPLAKPAIIAGVLLALMETLADYGTVQYFSLAVFTTGIFRIWYGLGDSLTAAQMSALLLGFVVVLFGIERASRRRARYFHTSRRYRPLNTVQLRGWAAWAACGVCMLPVLFGFLLPFLALLLWASYTFREQWGEPLLSALLNSLMLALLTSVLALVLAILVYMGCRLRGGLGERLALLMARFGYAVPGTVVAVGILVPVLWLDGLLAGIWEQITGSAMPLLIGSLPILVFAYLVRFLAVSLNTVEASMAKIPPSLGEAGRCLGLRSLQVLRRIYLPIMQSGLLAALLLVFVEVLKELPATLLLRPFDFNTLALYTYELANEERLADAACPALAIVLISLIPIVLLGSYIEYVRPGSQSGPSARQA